MKYRSVALGFAVCICMLAAIPVSAAGVFSAWDYRMKVTFDGYRPSGAETLTNFPALVVLSTNITGFRYSDFKSGTNDLRFADSTESTALNFEVDTWDTNGTSCVWVQVPSLATNTDFIYVYYGKAGQIAPACTTNGATWTNTYVVVNHLNGTAATDSTSNRYNGTLVNSPVSTSGIVGSGLDLGALNSTKYYTLPNISGSIGTNAGTLLMWLKRNAATPANATQSGFVSLNTTTGGDCHYPFTTPGLAYMTVFRNTTRVDAAIVILAAGMGGKWVWRRRENSWRRRGEKKVTFLSGLTFAVWI